MSARRRTAWRMGAAALKIALVYQDPVECPLRLMLRMQKRGQSPRLENVLQGIPAKPLPNVEARKYCAPQRRLIFGAGQARPRLRHRRAERGRGGCPCRIFRHTAAALLPLFRIGAAGGEIGARLGLAAVGKSARQGLQSAHDEGRLIFGAGRARPRLRHRLAERLLESGVALWDIAGA